MSVAVVSVALLHSLQACSTSPRPTTLLTILTICTIHTYLLQACSASPRPTTLLYLLLTCYTYYTCYTYTGLLYIATSNDATYCTTYYVYHTY